MAYTMETVKQIWDDDSGNRIEVGPDRDALGLIEIREYIGNAPTCLNRITLTIEQATLLRNGISELLPTLSQ